MALSFKTFVLRRGFRPSFRAVGFHAVTAVVVVLLAGLCTVSGLASAQLFAPPVATDEDAELAIVTHVARAADLAATVAGLKADPMVREIVSVLPVESR